jgi:hypothetical protein
MALRQHIESLLRHPEVVQTQTGEFNFILGHILVVRQSDVLIFDALSVDLREW